MQFGAHESMETHEILLEKINAISHFNLYAKEARNPELRAMVVRHQQDAINSYNEIVGYTRGNNNQFRPLPPNTSIQGMSNQQIQYGLRNPPQQAPATDTAFDDREIATAVLLCHKNGARNATWASLECADPNLRRMMMNSAATCVNQAYEVFLFMNQQGMYQVPTMQDQTTQNFLHSYQPAGQHMQSSYGQMNMAGSGASYPVPGPSASQADGANPPSVHYGTTHTPSPFQQ